MFTCKNQVYAAYIYFQNLKFALSSLTLSIVGSLMSSRIMQRIVSTSCVVVRFSWDSLANLCAAILGHAERLQAPLRPSWPNAGEIQDKMYCLVDTLMLNSLTAIDAHER